MNCSYCNSEMDLTTVKVKRPVPNGANDLNLHDDVTCWQCPQCKKTSVENLVRCKICHTVTLECYHTSIYQTSSGTAPKSLITNRWRDRGDLYVDYTCLNCLKCSKCGQPFDGQEIVQTRVKDYDSNDFDGEDCYSVRYPYVHKNCPQGHTKSEENNSGSTYSTQTTTPEKSRKPLVIFFIIVAFVVWAIFINDKGSNTRLKPSSTFVGKECNLRSTPSKGRNIIKTIPKGGSVTILENSGEWVKVRYINSEGYIKSNLLSSR